MNSTQDNRNVISFVFSIILIGSVVGLKANRFGFVSRMPGVPHTCEDDESDKIDKVLSALGVSYKPDLHY